MINAFYSGMSGAKSFQTRLNVSANNMANANTAGYESQQATFTDLMYTNLTGADGAPATLQTGNGVRASDISSALTKGTIEQTGRNEDIALLGDGYFCVQDAQGNRFFTRSGNFHFEINQDQRYLMTANGDSVLDENLIPVKVPADAQNTRFGGPSTAPAGEDGMINLAVIAFSNPYGLSRDGYGRMAATAASGVGALALGTTAQQGALEGSNVDLVTEMSDMMQAQRGFQFSTKILQTADEMENVINSLRQ